jgi:hypothetical protein
MKQKRSLLMKLEEILNSGLQPALPIQLFKKDSKQFANFYIDEILDQNQNSNYKFGNK